MFCDCDRMHKFFCLIFSYCCAIFILSEIKGSATHHIPTDFALRSRRETSCGRNSFQCRDGSCIQMFSICDGVEDCRDGSDETFATCITNYECPKKTFRCAYGGCIDSDKKCNGLKDCADNSDELLIECPTFKWLKEGINKTCTNTEFQCRNGDCIKSFLVCDGRRDCPDGSDETVSHCNAPDFICPRNTFRCAYGACVDSSSKCNKVVDCADESDEDVHLCNSLSNSSDITERPQTVLPSVTQPPQSIHHDCSLPESTPGTEFIHVMKNLIKVKCVNNSVLKFDKYDGMRCIKGKWSPQQICVPLCEPLNSVSAIFTCNYEGNVSDCSSPVKPGTRSTAVCAPGYKEFPSNQISNKNTCLEDGQWDQLQFSCTEACGEIYNPQALKTLISHGSNTSISEFPWNVGIYKRSKENKMVHICGGSLISAYAIITAGHCFRDEFTYNFLKSDIMVGVGKYHRDWDIVTNFTRKISVAEIFIHPGYKGISDNYKHDIALIELSVNVVLSAVVLPICLPAGSQNPRNNQTGFVVGWGHTENGVASDILLSSKLAYLNRKECLKLVPGLESKITEDKFCALVQKDPNATNVMPGDSGAGFIFEYGQYYYIHGIVSTKVDDRTPTFSDVNIQINRDFLLHTHQNILRRRTVH